MILGCCNITMGRENMMLGWLNTTLGCSNITMGRENTMLGWLNTMLGCSNTTFSEFISALSRVL